MEQQVETLPEKSGSEMTTTTPNNNNEAREKKYFSRRDSLGSQKLEPLQGFVCVLTQTVMDDPVETSSGQTFERRAIEKWIADGNELCPLTNARLEASHLRSNRTLKQSIEEWRDRNSIIAIAALKPKLYSGDEEEVSRGLSKLRDLCQQGEYYRECIEMEDFVPVIVGLLDGKNREVRNSALVTLCILASQREENKEKIIEGPNSLKNIVRSLARQPDESKSALRLLLELSRSERARNLIGNIHGCILILVTKLTSDDEEVSRDAQELINVLSFLEQNVKQMAKANYFKPLLQLLCSGTEDVKIRMAETLAEIELTDHSKKSIVDDGAVKPLIQMLSEDDLENKKVAMKCLLQLSSLPQNASSMFEEGLIELLFEILYRHSLQSPLLREQVAATIMNLSLSIACDDLNLSENVRILKSDDDVFKFFSLVSLTGDDVKRSILGTFIALCRSPSGLDIRTSLRQISAVRVLVQLSEAENVGVRANALKLFYCLIKDYNDEDGDSFLEHIDKNFIETLLRIIQTSNDSDEISSSLGIIAYLPKAQHITQWLINAEALKTIHDCLSDRMRDSSQRNQISENGVAAFRRFTVSTNIEWQNRVAQVGVIRLLVHFLCSGTDFAKQNAAVSLKQLSENSKSLSKPVKKGSGFLCCISFSSETGCPVHLGICGTESSFCLVEAKAVEPLVSMLGERNLETREASLDALLTLVDPLKPEIGGNLLDKANAIMPIIRMLSSNCVRVQEKCLKGLEVIFRDDGLIRKYGNSVQMPLVDITSQMRATDQREIRSLAATLLSRLGVLGIQTSFF